MYPNEVVPKVLVFDHGEKFNPAVAVGIIRTDG